MAHFPVNHPARPLYRVLAGLVGLYILVFGVVGRRRRPGATRSSPGAATGRSGLRTNLAFSLVSVVFGASSCSSARSRRATSATT